MKERIYLQLNRRLKMQYNEVINFWFNEITPDQWWIKDLKFDQAIKQRFFQTHQQANACELYHWRETPQGRLAEIIVLDQFSRNIYRDTPSAFASDSLALALAQSAIEQQADKALKAHQRSFLYMPFMHSESLNIHQQAVSLYKENGIESSYEFELKHYKIINEFGRYPHRNDILGRLSTPEEVTFLTQPNSSF